VNLTRRFKSNKYRDNGNNMIQDRGVLLANLGSPDEPTESAVRSYLNQFLMDPYVIQLPWVVRRMLVSLFILPRRPADSAKAYQSIWWEEGSPLVVLSSRACDELRQIIDMPISVGMRYGNPSIEHGLLQLAANSKVKEVLFIPMYPHYAESTIMTSVEEAKRVIREHNLDFRLNVLPPFFDRQEYINALVTSTENHLKQGFDHLLFSYHGLPELHIRKADPTGSHCLASEDCCQQQSLAHATCYRHQVLKTTELFVARSGLGQHQYSVSFQSRLGRAKWLDPSTEDTLRKLGGQGVKKLLVLCPAFVTDCLETLEEIGIRGAEVFVEAGGESLELVPCLNNHEAWLNVLASWCTQPAISE
jgi:ferrochelatase